MRTRDARTFYATLMLGSACAFALPALAAGLWIDGEPAVVVLGQPNFTTTGGALSASVMDHVFGVAVDPTNGKVFIADGNRILRFSSAAAAVNGSAAEALFGQSNPTTGGSNAGSAVAAAHTFWTADQMVVDSSGRLWVADRDNHRVLRFDNASVKANDANADAVLGQATFVANAANRGGNVAANTLNLPTGIGVDGMGALWVADSANNRVLGYGFPAAKANGAAADIVLGQADFTHNAVGGGAVGMRSPISVVVSSDGAMYVADSLNSRVLRFDNVALKNSGASADGTLGHTGIASASSMSTPEGVAVDDSGRLYVADTQFNRILIFNNASSKANGANADNVLGQTNFTASTANTGGLSASTLSRPSAIVFDGAAQVLWTADYVNSRALRYSLLGAVLDIDASGAPSKYDALTDGLLTLRYLFGLSGSSLTSGALGGTATRADPVTIKTYLDSIRPMLDIDGNGTSDALTDGLLVIRYLFGLRGASLTAGAIGPNAMRNTAPLIEAYLQSLMP